METEAIKKTLIKAQRFGNFKFNTQVEYFIELTAIADELKAESKRVKAALDVINAKLVKVYVGNKTQGHNSNGRLVYLHSQIWAGRCDGIGIVDAIAALKRARLGKKYIKESVDMDRLHVQFRQSAEISRDGKPVIPDNLKDIFKATEKFGIKSRKA